MKKTVWNFSIFSFEEKECLTHQKNNLIISKVKLCWPERLTRNWKKGFNFFPLLWCLLFSYRVPIVAAGNYVTLCRLRGSSVLFVYGKRLCCWLGLLSSNLAPTPTPLLDNWHSDNGSHPFLSRNHSSLCVAGIVSPCSYSWVYCKLSSSTGNS